MTHKFLCFPGAIFRVKIVMHHFPMGSMYDQGQRKSHGDMGGNGGGTGGGQVGWEAGVHKRGSRRHSNSRPEEGSGMFTIAIRAAMPI